MQILSQMVLPVLLDEIANPDFPSPACVSASAIIASIASSLIEMGCGCTLDEKSCSLVHSSVEKSQERCREIREKLLYLAQKDIEIFKDYLELKKGFAGENTGIKHSFTMVPLDIARSSCLLLEEVLQLIPLGYEKIICDFIVAKGLLTVNIGNMLLVVEENIRELEEKDRVKITFQVKGIIERRDNLNLAIEEAWKIRKEKQTVYN